MNASNPCPHCGENHRSSARFCSKTGKPLGPRITPRHRAKVKTGHLQPDQTIGDRYIVVKKIAQGLTSAIYMVQDPDQPGMVWAIKEMSGSVIPDPYDRTQAQEDFQNEIRTLKQLSHPNIPEVVEEISDGDTQYLVMEYVPGKTLTEILAGRPEPFSEEEVLPWMMQLCDALAYLHSRKPQIIFRDLKPDNIMITPDGQVKLIDFGIVRFFKPGKRKDTLNLGTPGYSAPEASHGQTDERSDVYSLCVTIHQLLTRHDPVVTLFNLPPVRQLNPTVSAKMERIIDRGIRMRRDRRWESARELQKEIATLLPSTSELRNRAKQPDPGDDDTPSMIDRLRRMAGGRKSPRD